MQSISLFLKRNLHWYFSTIIIINIIFILCWTFECAFFTTTLFILIFEAIRLRYKRNNRESIGQRDAIVITGCDSGLGYSLAIHCHEHLNIQVIAGVHKENSQGSRELTKFKIPIHSLDIMHKESIETFVQWTIDRLKEKNLTLRSVVNNAGVMIFGEFEWLTEEQIHHQIAVNLLGTMNLTKKMLALIRKHRSRLIIVTSHCASEPLPGVAIYSATKAGLAAWTTSLRVELKKFGISVVNFVPGSFMKDSNLLSQQQKHFEIMESTMPLETKLLYSEYFRRYTDYLSPLSRSVEPQRVNNPQLYEVFNDALLERHPYSVYKCEPWRYMFYHNLFKITPAYLRDWLVEKFIQMPAWKENNI